VHVTFVKKVLVNGEACRKCGDVEQRLSAAGYWPRIDAVVVADARDPASEGMRLAARHGVTVAPFFLVQHKDQARVYTIYLQFVREVLEATPAAG
jgi:hypothetical protein